MIEIIIGTVGIVLTILLSLTAFLYNRNKKLKAYYEIKSKRSSSLKPEEALGIRGDPKFGFHPYYYQRKEDEVIRKKIENNENALIIGNPLVGKSRAIYQALTSLKEPRGVIIPRVVDINPEDFLVPLRFGSWREAILLLDDIDKFTEKQNFKHLLDEFMKRGVIIVATCRIGPEYEKLCGKMEKELHSIFGNPIRMREISRDEGEEVAQQTGRQLPHTFDGNIGSIFLQLDTMKQRFRNCTEVQKGILRSMKRLYYAGIYREREIFSTERIKRVCEKKEEIEKKRYEWGELFKELKNRGFIEIIKDEVQAEETYLEFVVEDEFSPLDNLSEIMSMFSNDSEALFLLGIRASEVGDISKHLAAYKEVAIKAFQRALKIWTLKNAPMDYAMAQSNLGIAYGSLAVVEDRAKNCKEAIKACEEALKVYTLDHTPMQYTMTQNNLGTAYRKLATVEDTAKNCKEAIKAFKEALKIWTLKNAPMDYAITQSNLGSAYGTLALVEDRAKNCNKAIKAFKEALKIWTLKNAPMDYAMAQSNLGNAYRTLAVVEDTAKNCNKAIKACEEALKIWTLKNAPMQYGMAQINLGNAYHRLATVEDTAKNCKEAIKAYKKALKVNTLDHAPMQYAITQGNLGIAYGTLALVEDRAKNCKEAIKAYKEALKVVTERESPEMYQKVKQNFEVTLDFCSNKKTS